MTFKLQRRDSYPYIFIISAGISVLAYYYFDPGFSKPELLFSLLGSISAFVYFLYAQHNSNTERFIVLFKDFNARYDLLNAHLNHIIKQPELDPLSEQDLNHLYDYFNLCAEEYMFYRAGYIEERVWSAWEKGMHFFLCNAKIAVVWEQELQQESYYGFAFRCDRCKSSS
jgi:hypothetical protein